MKNAMFEGKYTVNVFISITVQEQIFEFAIPLNICLSVECNSFFVFSPKEQNIKVKIIQQKIQLD